MADLRELETTVLQSMASSVNFYKSLGLTAKSTSDEIDVKAKMRAKVKFGQEDNDENMITLIGRQQDFLGKVKDMLGSEEAYRTEYETRLEALKVEDANDLDSQIEALFNAPPKED